MDPKDPKTNAGAFGAAAAVPDVSQVVMDRLVGEPLDKAIESGMPEVMKWMKSYTKLAEQGAADVRPDTVLPKLYKAGYTSEKLDSPDVATGVGYGHKLIGVMMHKLAQGQRPLSGKYFDYCFARYQALLGNDVTPRPT
jgi:hypothetical protein